MTILIVGATGTLGRQIVKQMLDSGYSTRCLVRNMRKAIFLQEWGAELVYGDLSLPETIPNALKGITIIIDVATLRPEDEIATLQGVDLIGKIALIKAAKKAKIKKFLFFSITENEKFQSISLMRLKKKIEDVLKNSGIPFTIFQISGFYQGLISQYAIPILEQQTIFTTEDSASISYLDTRDIAKICTKFLISNDILERENNTIQLNGPKNWNSLAIIKLCEELSGQSAKITFIPLFILGFIKKITALSKWSWDIQDRLSFSEVLLIKKDNEASSSPNLFYSNLDLQEDNLIALEIYFQDYFENMLRKLRDLNYDQNQFAKRKDLTF
jgi:uncharacterized protein YbjT (DUF2867 family)|tara:strand:+ start:3713 stop:4696 length:984 start_codon:yes stop_codon:yes gene_type:complete